MSSSSEDLSRYSKQTRFAPFGKRGQRRLLDSKILICGCGALGSVIANTLVRAGVGHVRLVDRDFLERSNLQRQVLYSEQDITDGLPKAIAAARRLSQINSEVVIEPIVADVTYRNLDELAEGVDLILDGTDNFETRLLLNDYAIKNMVPWIFGGVIGGEGQVMPILPGKTACLACLVPEPPLPGETPTCDTAGVLGAAVNVIASIESLEAMKLLARLEEEICTGLTVMDLWNGRSRRLAIKPSSDCRACGQHDYAWLEGRRASETVVLCDKGAVQIRPPEGAGRVDLDAMRAMLSSTADVEGEVTGNQFLIQFTFEGHEVTLFADGRAILGGTKDESEARGLLARCLGG